MSDRLLKESDVIEAFKGRESLIHDAYTAVAIIRSVPSADRPQGEWIAVDSYSAFGGSEEQWNAHGNPIAYHYCSNCKSQTRVDEFGEEMLTDFCPNCGARMKGADDE